MHTQNVYEIFWQAPGWPAFPSGYTTAIQNWVADVGVDDGKTSNPFGTISQYSDTGGPGQYNVHFAGAVIATDAPDSHAREECTHGSICISEQSLVDEINTIRIAHGLPTGMSYQFAIVLPPRVTTCDVDGNCSDDIFCAYHSYYLTQQTDDPSTDVVFLTLPFEPGNACHTPDGSFVEPEPNGQSDVLIGAMSHEMREATTDPHLDAWFDSQGNEADDKCDTDYGGLIGQTANYNQYINGHPYETQLEWSNALDGCYQMDPPTFSHISATSGRVGASIILTGTNLFASLVNFAGSRASFTFSNDGTSVTTTVPPTAADGTLFVFTPSGEINAGTFTVAPTISSISPASGIAGSSITITGSSFSPLAGVVFTGDGDADGVVTSHSSTQVVVQVPSNAIRGPITVYTHSSPVVSTPSSAIFSPLPSISGLDHTTVAPGDTVHVSGTNFTANGPVSVTVAGVAACSSCTATATSVAFTVPNGPDGAVVVTNGDGSATSAASLHIVPRINGVSGSATPGGHVILTGAGFAGVTSVAFGGNTENAAFTVGRNGTVIDAIVPAGITSGRIGVTNANGTVLSPSSFVIAPTITSFAPVSVQVGATIGISGAGLDTADRVDFAGGVSAVPTNVTGTSLQVVVPASAQTGVFSVHTSSGSVASGRPLTITFSTSRFSPAKANYGATVTITGSALTGVTGVLFNGVPGTNVTVVDDSHVTVTVPASGSLTGQVTVMKGGVSVHPSGLFTLFGLHSATPNAGPAGTTVVLSGVGLSGVTRVTFSGGVTGTFTVNSDTQITVTVPVGATNGAITVSVPGAAASIAYSVT
jgi:hypothetical protein